MKRMWFFLKEMARIDIMVVAIVLAVAVVQLHVHTVRVLSQSMAPTVAAGDIALVRSIPSSNLKVGMVLLAKDPRDGTSYLHRIKTIDRNKEGFVVQTKGDANPMPDSWVSSVTAPETYVMFGHLHLGWIGQVLPVW